MADEPQDTHLSALGARFMDALQLRANGRSDEAMEHFRAILLAEPRLAEPRMEVARILFDQGRLEDAEEEAREAIRILEKGGQWTEEVPENVVLAMAWSLLGAILQEQAQSDDVVFGEPARFEELIRMSRLAYARAAELDPEDRVSMVNAAELGDRPEGEDEEGGESEADEASQDGAEGDSEDDAGADDEAEEDAPEDEDDVQ